MFEIARHGFGTQWVMFDAHPVMRKRSCSHDGNSFGEERDSHQH